jgi:hypothetical protein
MGFWTDKHLPQRPFRGQFFKMATFFYESYLSMPSWIQVLIRNAAWYWRFCILTNKFILHIYPIHVYIFLNRNETFVQLLNLTGTSWLCNWNHFPKLQDVQGCVQCINYKDGNSDCSHCKDIIPKIRNKYFQERNCAATVPIPTDMFLWAINIFLCSVCLFCWWK